MKIIALEEHILDKAIGAASGNIVQENYPYSQLFLNPPKDVAPSNIDLFELGERRIKEMDNNGITMEILSYTNATQWIPGPKAIDLSRTANNILAQAVKSHPDRFRAFATLPWSDPIAASQELRRTIKELGFVGVLLSGRPQTGNVYLDDKCYYPIWEVLTEFDLPIYIHPNFTSPDVIKAYYTGLNDQVNTILSTYGFGWHLEAGMQVIRMILAGVFEKFPTLKVISGHWGEIVPYYLPRLDQMLIPSITGLKEKFSFYYKRNVYVTPSGVYDYDSLEFCIKKLGIDHLLFSADFPYIPENDARQFLENAPLSDEDKEKFASKNAIKLLHLAE